MDLDARKVEIKAIPIIILCLFGCSDKGPKISDTNINMEKLPVQEFFDSTKMSLTENNVKIWTLNTTHLVKYRMAERIFINPVDITYFTRDGTSRLTADSGHISHEMDTLVANSNVRIRTSDNKLVTTSYIAWHKMTDKISSDRFVKMVTQEGDVYSGTGFIANTNLSEWKILKNVKAQIHEVDKKM
jgi:LPS export ABC transporter protein LptC